MFIKDIEIIKRNQAEILELKNSMNKMKNVIESTFSRVAQIKGRISELENRNSEITQLKNKEKSFNEEQRKPL